MKKKLCILGALLLIAALAVSAWFYGYHSRKSNDNLPNLKSLSRMEEAQVNAIVSGYRRTQLHEVWGEPEQVQDLQDVWAIADGITLTVNYRNDNGKAVVCDLQATDPESAVEFHGQIFRTAELSPETLQWLDWYLTLSPEEQLAVSYVPSELYIYDGTGTVDAVAGE